MAKVPARSDFTVNPAGAYAVRTVVAAGPARRRKPPEPWRYGVLAFVAWIWAILGVGQFVLAVLVSLGGLALGEGGGHPEMAPVPALMVSGVTMVGMLLSAGFVLLAVDVARDVRALRWKS